ncbi:hypothetical protein HZ993_00480 [Rhodoferax sp. AJA081-3]|uniref:hypothetical protein n=1 Tax=Rhodoferax sp. AJA081-3 TaxID=2752316 RepID=UPI001AE018B7|nr:hypothetical protein [Rhodoferax sp. AJA081-3]QTN28371.1 hypothetical protein HZ993_00480 [Rhodoferax sp. AJA081-3]
MFSFLRSKKKKASAEIAAAAEAHAKRMDLEERKAFRQEMLYQSIRESFLAMEVIGSMYKFKVMPVDVRHHRFIAMIDVAKSFVTGKDAKTKSFAALEKLMRSNAYKRFGVLIEGIYWRVSETESQFDRLSRTADGAESVVDGTPAASMVRQRPVTPTMDQANGEQPLARHAYQPVSDDEAKAFMEALQNGLTPPVVRVGEWEYQSDLAPLDSGIMIGGTQYGKLQ